MDRQAFLKRLRREKMEFSGLEKTSLIEWPNKAVAIAYTAGCNFRCPYCQNKDLALNTGNFQSIGEDVIIDYLQSRKKWLDGLAVTGGEPTLHPSLFSFAQKVKEEGFDFGLETNGSRPKDLKKFIEEGLVDRVFLDVKAALAWEKYKKAMGVDNEELFEGVKGSINLLQNSDIEYEYRTTVVPGIVNEADLMEIGKDLEDGAGFYLQQFIPQNTLNPDYEDVEPYPDEKLENMRDELDEKFDFEVCEVRNL